MVSFIEGLKSGLKSAYCSEVSNTPQWFANLRSVLIPGSLREQADNLNRWICDLPPDETADIPTPVTGGQCPGVTYQVQAIGINTGNGNPFNVNTGNWVGPIRSQGTGITPPTCSPGNFYSDIEFRSGNDELIIRQQGCAPFPQDIRVVATPVNPSDEPPRRVW